MNKDIKIALIISGMKQWKLAELMGISEFGLCRKLRHELPEEEQQRIIQLINNYAKEQKNA